LQKNRQLPNVKVLSYKNDKKLNNKNRSGNWKAFAGIGFIGAIRDR